MRKGFIIVILLALGIVLFIFTLKNVGLPEIAEALSLLNIRELILVLAILFLGLVVMAALKWRVIIKAINPDVPRFSKIFLARWVGYSISYLTPAALFGGEPVRFYMLKQDSPISSGRIAASIILDKLILALISCVYFFIGIFFLLFYLHLSWLAGIISFGLFFSAIFAFWFLLRRAKRISSEKGLFVTIIKRLYLNKLKSIKDKQGKISNVEEEIINFFKSPKKIILETVFLTILEISFVLLGCWLIIFFIGQDLEIPKLFAIKSIVDLSYVIPFPAALGTLEISQAFVFQVLGSSLVIGIAFSLVLRALSMFIAFIGLLILGWLRVKYLFRKIINFFPVISFNGREYEKKSD